MGAGHRRMLLEGSLRQMDVEWANQLRETTFSGASSPCCAIGVDGPAPLDMVESLIEFACNRGWAERSGEFGGPESVWRIAICVHNFRHVYDKSRAQLLRCLQALPPPN